MKAIKTPAAFVKAFLAKFPAKPESAKYECDQSTTWMEIIDGHPTTGECYINGLPVVDYYDGFEPTYTFGILTSVTEWAHSVGWFAEMANPGTVKFYKI